MGLHVVPLSRRGLSARLTTLVVTFVLALSAYGTSVASAATPYQTAVLGSTPSSYLRLGELAGATTARNEVVGALDGGYLGSFHFADKGAEVGELAPSLQGGYVSVPDGAATGPTGDMAVEFWMKPNSISTTVPIVEKYGRTVATGGANNSLDGYQLRLNVGGTVTATLYGSAGATVAATSTQPLEAGRWAHIVAADDGTALRLYVNGVATATTLVTFATTRSPNPLAIGASSGPTPGPANNRFWGRLDEVAIYDRALSATEVTDHFSRAVAAPEIYNGAIVSGTPLPGSTMSVTNGTWSPAVLPTITYRWQRCRYLTYSCTDIPGATAQTYVVAAADDGYRLTSVVTATNPAGSASNTPMASTGVGYGGSVAAANASFHMRLGEASGTSAVVELGGGSYGTYGAGAVLGKPGIAPPDTSVQIGSGPVSAVDYPTNGPTGDMSVEAWVKPATMGSAQSIVEKYGHTSTTGGANNSFDGYALRTNAAGTVTATLFGSAGATAVVTGGLLAAGRWAHVVAADDATTLRLYVNGQLAASAPVAFAATRSPNPLYIGAASGPAPGFGGSTFSGRIDEVAIYDGGLTAAQIADHFSRATPVPEVATAPQVSGVAVVGSTVSVSPGVWSPVSAPTISYQWQRCSFVPNCYDISGATGPTYVPVAADAQMLLRAKVTATNSAGTGSATTATTAAVGYPGAIAASNPSAYFRFGEPSGTAAKDEVAGAPDGAYGAGALLGKNGVDPPDPSVQIGSAPVSVADASATSPTGDLSVEAWVKPAAIGADQSIVEKYGHKSTTGGANDSLDGYRLRMNGDGTASATLFASDGASASVTSPQPLTAGRWAHLVAADDGTSLRLYVNGEVAAITPVTFAATRSPNPLHIGAASGPAPGFGGSPFSGRVDEVALYDRALTAADVADHLARGVAFPENVVPPAVSGTADDNSPLTADPGVWSPQATPAFAYQWLKCNGAGTSCVAVAGATSSTYAPTTADIGSRFVARVAASNSKGTVTISSAASAVVQTFDSVNPALALSGELYDNAWLGTGTHPLHLEATDGTAQSPGSGITSIEVKVDGSREAYWTQPCAVRNCAMAKDFSFDAGARSNGPHTITAIATDATGRTTTTTWVVKVDKVVPNVTLGGTLRDDMAAEHTATSYTLQANANDDAGAPGPLSGVKSVEILIDGVQADYTSQACNAGGCTLDRTFTYVPATYGEGDHGVRMVIRDQVGNESVREWTVKGHLSTACDPGGTPSTAPVGDVAPGAAPVGTATALSAVSSVQPELVDDDSADSTPPGTGGEPALVGGGNTLTATASEATTSIDRNPRNGFSTSLHGTTICVRPQAVDPAAKDASTVSSNAAVSANTSDAVDTVVKPTPSGVETFTSMRDASAPETYSWKVGTPGAELQPSGGDSIAVVDPNATRAASDAGLKPADEPVAPAEIPALVNGGEIDSEAVPPDPGAAQQAGDAIQNVTPITSGDLPADATESVTSQPPIQPPDDAVVTDDQEVLDQKAHDVQQDARQDAATDLAQGRADAITATSDNASSRASADQETLAGPVVVGSISAPAAVDANGNAIPTTLSADGDTVTMHVDHKASPDIAYPVVADPWVRVQHTRLVWRCCHAVYRYETRLSGYENRLVLLKWAPRAAIFSHPHIYLGSGFYQVEWGGFISRTLMVDQPISPVYIALPFPVYTTVPVLDHMEYFLDTETYETQEWHDDPAPINPYSGHDNSIVAAAPLDDPDPPEPAPYCYSDPGSPDADYCGEDAGSNPDLQDAIAEPPAAAEFGNPADGLAKRATDAKSQWGMAEEGGNAFGDPRYVALGLKRARLKVPWNIMDDTEWPPTNATKIATLNWLRDAKAAKVKVLISFGLDHNQAPTPILKCPPPTRPMEPPPPCSYSEKTYETQTNKFLNAYKWVKEYTAWNEPNFTAQFQGKAKVAGQFWLNLYRRCNYKHCVVAAGDFADRNLTSAYVKEYKKGARINPPIWAFHGYVSGIQHQCDRTASGPASKDRVRKRCPLTWFLDTTMSSSSVWLTEQGAIRDNSGGTSRTPDETAHDVAQLVELPGFSKRIKRFYYFSWRGGSSWDSGLIDYKTDKKRERMYNTFRDALPQWP